MNTSNVVPIPFEIIKDDDHLVVTQTYEEHTEQFRHNVVIENIDIIDEVFEAVVVENGVGRDDGIIDQNNQVHDGN
jgi:hypothetical protein